MREVGTLAEHGGARRGADVQGDNITLYRGTNPTYLLRRLKRDRVGVLLKIDEPPSGKHGANQHGGERNTLSSHNHSATGILKRLKRDNRLDLAERVIAGTISANAGGDRIGARGPGRTDMFTM